MLRFFEQPLKKDSSQLGKRQKTAKNKSYKSPSLEAKLTEIDLLWALKQAENDLKSKIGINSRYYRELVKIGDAGLSQYNESNLHLMENCLKRINHFRQLQTVYEKLERDPEYQATKYEPEIDFSAMHEIAAAESYKFPK